MNITNRCRTPALFAAAALCAGLAQAQDPAQGADPAQATPAEATPAQAAPSPAAPATPRGGVLKEHIALAPDQVVLGPCPAALPSGARCAVVEGDPQVPGALFAFRARLPDGYRIAPHFHGTDEHVVVLGGTFHMGMGDKFDTNAGQALPAGGFMAMPAGEHHYAWAEGTTDIQVYAIGPWSLTYVNPQDDPRGPPAGN